MALFFIGQLWQCLWKIHKVHQMGMLYKTAQSAHALKHLQFQHICNFSILRCVVCKEQVCVISTLVFKVGTLHTLIIAVCMCFSDTVE